MSASTLWSRRTKANGAEDLRTEVDRRERRGQFARLGHVDESHGIAGGDGLLGLHRTRRGGDLRVDPRTVQAHVHAQNDETGLHALVPGEAARTTEATTSVCPPAWSCENLYINPGSTTPAAYAPMRHGRGGEDPSAKIVSRIDVMP